MPYGNLQGHVETTQGEGVHGFQSVWTQSSVNSNLNEPYLNDL